ncbi:MAG: c-type cytochrome [Bacteroidia bacterium]
MKIQFVANNMVLRLGLLAIVGLIVSCVNSGELPKPKTPLAVYGKHIYNKQKCYKCHTFNEESASKKLISLDGYGQEHSVSYTTHYLLDPQSIIYSSKKKSYEHLLTNLIEKETFEKILEDENRPNSESEWNELTIEANGILNELSNYGFEGGYTTEFIALLSFIHNTPKSKFKRTKDSIALDAEQKEFEEMTGPNSVLMQTANLTDAETLEKGEKTFKANCRVCHATGGGVAIDLENKKYATSATKEYLATKIVKGNPKKGMAAWGQILLPEDIGSIIAYLETFENK